LFGATFISIFPWDFLELAPFSLLRIPINLLYWWLGLVVFGLALLAVSFP